MKTINQSHEVLECSGIDLIETAGRTCYRSKPKGDPAGFVRMLRDRRHHAMLEFGSVTVRFITNRGVSHELVRHRLASFAQESTRYVRYDGNMEFIRPVWLNEDSEPGKLWIAAMTAAEQQYKHLLGCGWRPEQAREVLPNSLATRIIVRANLREWRHILALRMAPAAHPQMRDLMVALCNDMRSRIPVVFDELG